MVDIIAVIFNKDTTRIDYVDYDKERKNGGDYRKYKSYTYNNDCMTYEQAVKRLNEMVAINKSLLDM